MSLERRLLGTGRSSEDRRRSSGDASGSICLFTDNTFEVPLLAAREKSISTVAVLYIVLLAVYAAVIVVAPWLLARVSQYQSAILCSCNVLLLALTGLLQKHLSKRIRKERRQGYLKFSEHLRPLIHIPFALVSYGLSIILLVVVWTVILSEVGVPILLLLRLLILLEISLTGAAVGLYIWKIHWHNSADLQPDVIYSLHSSLQPPPTLADLRYLDGGRLVEQQALLLRYQQDNLRYLSEEILRLQENLNKYERTEDGTPQVDVAHILAAREQELRAITVERDQLQSELRLARGLIAERDSNVAQIRSVNDRYVEENERLRAMLAEWSARTAKLELALEAERISNAELHKKVAMLRHANVESAGD